MKTVSGTIVSTKPVNLSKAANILSNFVTSENGASQSVSTYLRRASVAFNELVYFKKHHKFKKNQPKEEVSTKSDISHRNLEDDEARVLENGAVNKEFDQNPVETDKNEIKNVEGKLKKKDKKKKRTEGSLGNGKIEKIEVEVEKNNESVKEKKKTKKKRKNAEVDGGENGNSATPERKKKRRKTES